MIGRTVDYAMGRNRYIGHLISIATRSFKNKKIGLDCANGSASALQKVYLMPWARGPLSLMRSRTVRILIANVVPPILNICRSL